MDNEKFVKLLEQSINAGIYRAKVNRYFPEERVWGIPHEVWSNKDRTWVANAWGDGTSYYK